jgi:cytochrome d ubiquinol oxidase subunit II
MKFDERGRRYERRWMRLFGLSSLLTPFFLGVSLGALATTRLVAARAVEDGFFAAFIEPWLQPFPLFVGALASCSCAFLAAVYLVLEAEDAQLRDDFRKRALWALGATVAAAVTTHVGAAVAEKLRYVEISRRWEAWLLLAGVVGISAACAWSLRRKRWRLARVAAVGQIVLMIAGFALWQDECLIRPDVTIRSAAAPEATLRLLVISLVLGAVILFPSLVWLLRVFKKRAVFGEKD